MKFNLGDPKAFKTIGFLYELISTLANSSIAVKTSKI